MKRTMLLGLNLFCLFTLALIIKPVDAQSIHSTNSESDDFQSKIATTSDTEDLEFENNISNWPEGKKKKARKIRAYIKGISPEKKEKAFTKLRLALAKKRLQMMSHRQEEIEVQENCDCENKQEKNLNTYASNIAACVDVGAGSIIDFGALACLDTSGETRIIGFLGLGLSFFANAGIMFGHALPEKKSCGWGYEGGIWLGLGGHSIQFESDAVGFIGIGVGLGFNLGGLVYVAD